MKKILFREKLTKMKKRESTEVSLKKNGGNFFLFFSRRQKRRNYSSSLIPFRRFE